MAQAATTGIDSASSSGIQPTPGRSTGGGSRKPKLIVLGKPFSGGAFVSYVFVNGKPAPANTAAQLKPGDEIAIAGGGLVGFLSWTFFQLGRPGKPIAILTAHSDSRVVFQAPDWHNAFDPGLPIMLAFTDKDKNSVWGIPVSFSFGEESEKDQQRAGGKKIEDQLNRKFGEGQKTGDGNLAMEATGAALAGVLSPFMPGADKAAARDALAAAFKSGDYKKVEQAINNLKTMGKDGAEIMREFRGVPPQFRSLLDKAIIDINNQTITKAEVVSNLEKIADTANVDDFDAEQEGGGQQIQTSEEISSATSGGGQSTVSVQESGGDGASSTVASSGSAGGTVSSTVTGSGDGAGSSTVNTNQKSTAEINQQSTARAASGGGGGTKVTGQAQASAGVSGQVPISAGNQQSSKVSSGISGGVSAAAGAGIAAAVDSAVGGLKISSVATKGPAGPETLPKKPSGESAVLVQPAGGQKLNVTAKLDQRTLSDVSGKPQGQGLVPASLMKTGAPAGSPSAKQVGKGRGEVGGAAKMQGSKQENIARPSPQEVNLKLETQTILKAEAKTETPTASEVPSGMKEMFENESVMRRLSLGREIAEQQPAEPPSGDSAQHGTGREGKDHGARDKEPSPPPQIPRRPEPGEIKEALKPPAPLPPNPKGESNAAGAASEGQGPESGREPNVPGEHLNAPASPENLGEGGPGAAAGGAPVAAGQGEGGTAGQGEEEAEEDAADETGAGAAGRQPGMPAVPVPGVAAGKTGQGKGKGEKDKLIKEATDLVNTEMNGFLSQGAIWVWAVAIPSFGLAVILGAVVGDLLFALKKRLIKMALDKVWIAKTIVGDEITPDEIADNINFSVGVKANVAVMNLITVLMVVLVIIFTGAVAYLGCTWPLGKTVASATNYQFTILGAAGLSGVCQSMTNVNVSLNNSINASTPVGSCAILPSGIATPGQLALTCFGSNPTIDATASIVAAHESGGNPAIPSSVDICQPGGQPVSFGLFQINITNHKINGLNCPAAFDYPAGVSPREYDANNHQCTIVDQTLYNNCVTAAETAEYNIAAACQISGNGTNWGAWQADINACGISKTISP
ncbi:MAG: hypothetical protein P4L74_00535 [Candidatus Doudnabacteria bacterium]|nr:hypothetical protein [Candidatus Doudnabacteria bacterium]